MRCQTAAQPACAACQSMKATGSSTAAVISAESVRSQRGDRLAAAADERDGVTTAGTVTGGSSELGLLQQA
jgi:hypothetical protein